MELEAEHSDGEEGEGTDGENDHFNGKLFDICNGLTLIFN